MEESNKIFLEKNKVFKNNELNVRKFNELDTKYQAEIIRLILESIYTGTKKIDIDNKYILKCIKLTCDEFDNNIHLPLGLLVKKEKNIITFEFQKRIGVWFIIFLLGALLFTIVGATYSAFNYIKLKDLNKDIDGDGVADINIDINEDEEAEINIDINKDDKPDINIDYKSNRKAIFNVQKEKQLLNPTNILDDKGACIRNCDANNDGWPDTNLDLNADGTPTIDLDLDHDGKADMNLDMDGDGICDLHCDEDNDNVCDKYCIENWSKVIIAINGSSEIVGQSLLSKKTATLEIEYSDLSNVVIENIIPDDMEGEGKKIPQKKFKVKNKSPYYVYYSLKWEDIENTFTSDNFKYKVDCNSFCKSMNFSTAPKEDSVFLSKIIIAPFQTHNYVVTFKLQGINAPQNFDQDKVFKGRIQVIYESYK